ncbi:MAG: hypothetical protein ACRD0X_01385, partial [Thermoanaerobaculia bacterium]
MAPAPRPTPLTRLARPPAAWLLGALVALPVAAHLSTGHRAATYAIAPPRAPAVGEDVLALTIVEAATGEPTAARFTLTLDDEPYLPPGLGGLGLRFTTHHTRRH